MPEQTATPQGPYRVLARKYRPATFEDLIGQAALVRTLTNGIEAGRVAQAYILTGVRGVGKTTTARIIARALNCVGPDGTGGPSATPCGQCENCAAIAEDRHVDVIEMDAASRTGIDDIRELIEGVRYRPVQARRKVYIIDEVHMLSRQAFNGLLKTLEEPPEHVVFIFATTEIRKVPVTVLSRCQRFDLRRVDFEALSHHFAGVAKAEGIEIADEALAMIARAADGSVRDGLSLLDQAIALGGTRVETGQVRAMLGLADRTRIFDLFEAALGGRPDAALALLADLYAAGADPAVTIQDLLELTHLLTRAKLVPDTLTAPDVPEAERVRGTAAAESLALPVLARTWQILLKGLGEVQIAPAPRAAAEMVLIRLAYASDLPTPGDLVARLSAESPAPKAEQPPAPKAEQAPPAPKAEQATGAGDEPTPMPTDFESVVALVRARRETVLANHLSEDVHPVRVEPGRIELCPGARAPRDLAGRLSEVLLAATGTRWVVSVSSKAGDPTLGERARAEAERRRADVLADPLVCAAMEAFPGARLIEPASAPGPSHEGDESP
ncbi:MAG: DNA polymerase III subunit gamma/tau [Kiloniellaceae bacterium]